MKGKELLEVTMYDGNDYIGVVSQVGLACDTSFGALGQTSISANYSIYFIKWNVVYSMFYEWFLTYKQMDDI